MFTLLSLVSLHYREDSNGYLLILLFTIFASSNIEICALPNIGFSLASALIILLFLLSCKPFLRIYSHIFFTISVLGIALPPITSAKVAFGVNGAMKAALGFLADFF